MTRKSVKQPEYVLDPVIFIISPPRSGSTLLRNMLAGNPALYSPPELYLLPFDDMKQRAKAYSKPKQWHLKKGLIQAFMELMQLSFDDAESFVQSLIDQQASTKSVYALIQSMLNERTLVDKSPSNAGSVINLKSALSWFAYPVFIHLHRHPYSAIESHVRQQRDRAKSGLNEKGQKVKPKKISKKQIHKLQENAEAVWLNCHINTLQLQDEVPTNRYIRVCYEKIAANPELEMQKLCRKLRIDYDPWMIDPYAHTKKLKKNKNPPKDLKFKQKSFPLGDPGFFTHDKIDAKVAEKWQYVKIPQPIAPETALMARFLGYKLPEWEAGFEY